jgi:type I restriction enzyme S subunit
MSAIQQLLTDHIDIWIDADTEKRSGRGRASGNAGSVYGIKKLRELILELAVRGKLVSQDPHDEPASELLKRIQAEKEKLVKSGRIKRDKPLPVITDEEKSFELPVGWEWVRLGEITNFGFTVKLNTINSNCWVLDLEDIEKDTSRLLQKLRFSERESLSDKNSFQKGDVLYCKLRPYLNKVIVADEDGVCTTEILPFRCYGPFESHYFKTALKSPHFLNYVDARSYGMKMPRLGTADGRMACFPLSPLAEQRRIVAKVDELMALCDQLETQHNNASEAHEKLVSHLLGTLTQSQNAEDFSENWQRIAAHFDTLFTTEASIDALKQTLLQLAVMGKLVPQDVSDEFAGVLADEIESKKKKMLKDRSVSYQNVTENPDICALKYEIPRSWRWARFSDVVFFQEGPGIRNWQFQKSGVKLLNVSNILFDDTLDFDKSDKYVSNVEFSDKYKHFQINEGDLLFAGSGASWGKIAWFKDPGYPVMLNTSTMRLRFFHEKFNGGYLFYFLKTRFFNKQMLLQLVGLQPNFGSTHLGRIYIPVPPLAEQHRIVVKVSELVSLCDQLKARITEANQLRQKLADVVVEGAVA